MSTPTRRNPAGGPGFGKDYQNALAALYGTRNKRAPLPKDWRNHLPDAGRYYALHVEGLKHANGDGWASGRCPFHEDKNASLSVNVLHGGWRCFAGCGTGDMVSFHERLKSLDFTAAVRELLGVAR